MIDKVSKIISKTELTPYSIYGSVSYHQNKNQNKKDEKFDTFNKDDKKSNPFDLDENKDNNKIQEYFNQRHAKINADIKDIVSRILKYSALIDSAIIDSQALTIRYLYNKTLPNEKDKVFKFINQGKIYSIEVCNLEDNLLLKVDFTKNNITKIKANYESYCFEIYLKKESFLNRIFLNNKTQILKYQKKDKNNNLQEEVIYSSNGQIERYVSYQDNKIQSEVYFDLSIAHFRPEMKNKLIPLKYSLYDIKSDYLLENLIYTYSLPNKYQQFNHTTGKIIKSFILQGLKSKVIKYTFFNSINGQMTVCGTL